MNRQAQSGAEEDCFGPWRRFYCYLRRPGVKAKIKRQARRRERREAKVNIRGLGDLGFGLDELDEYLAAREEDGCRE